MSLVGLISLFSYILIPLSLQTYFRAFSCWGYIRILLYVSLLDIRTMFSHFCICSNALRIGSICSTELNSM